MFTHHQSEPTSETEQQLLFNQCLSALCALPDSISRRTALSLSIEYRNQQPDRFTDLFDRHAPERGEAMERLLEVVRRATDLDEVNFWRLACEVKDDRVVSGKSHLMKRNGTSGEREIRDSSREVASVKVSATTAVVDIEDEEIGHGLGNDDRQVEQHDRRDRYERDIIADFKHQDCRNAGESEKEMFAVEEEEELKNLVKSEKSKEIIVVVVPENVVPFFTGEDGPTTSDPESNVVNYGVPNGKKVDETSIEFPFELEDSTKEITVLKKKKRSTKKRNADRTAQIGSEESMVQGVKEEWTVEPLAGGEPKDTLFPIHMTPKPRIISKVDTLSIGQEMTEPVRESCPFAGLQQGTGKKEDGRLEGSSDQWEPDIADANFRELRNRGSGKDPIAVEEPEKVEGMAKFEETIAVVLRNLVAPTAKVDPSTNTYHPKADEPEFVSTNVAGQIPDVLKEKKNYVTPTQFCAASQDMNQKKKKKKKKRGNKKKHTDMKAIVSDNTVAETVANEEEEELASEPVASAEQPKDVEGFSIPIHMIPTISIVSGLDILSIVQNTRTEFADSMREGEPPSARKQYGKTPTLVCKYGKDDDRSESVNQWESDIAAFNYHEPQNFGETQTDVVEGPELAEDMEKVEETIALVLANFVPSSKDDGGLLSSETEVVSTNAAGEIPNVCKREEEVVIPLKICTRTENNSRKKKKNNRKKSRKKNTDSKVPGIEEGGTGSKDESLVENPEPNGSSSPMNMTIHDIKMDPEDSMQEGNSSARQPKSTTTSLGHEVETPVLLEEEPPIPQNRASGPFTTTCSRLYPSVISCSCPGHRNISPATEHDQKTPSTSSLARASPSHADRLESKQNIWQKTVDLSIFGNERIENYRSIALPKELSDPAIICTGSFRNYPKFAVGSNDNVEQNRSATSSFGIPISIKDLVRSSALPPRYPEAPLIPNRNGQSPPPKFGLNQTVPKHQTQSNAHARRQGDVAPHQTESSTWILDATSSVVAHRNGGSRSRSNYKTGSVPNRRYDKPPSGLNTEELRRFVKDRWHEALSRAVGYPGTGAPREIVLYHDEFDCD